MSKRVAYVTGGMGGIGTAICQRLHKEGFTVIAVVGKGRGGDTRAQRLTERMGGAVFLHRRKQGRVHPFLP